VIGTRASSSRAPGHVGPARVPRPLAAAVGVVADGIVGEPPARVHPVGLFGRCMEHVERAAYRDRRAAGAVHAALGTGLGVAAGAIVGSTVTATYLGVAGRALRDTAASVGDALESSDLGRARALLPSLVGRDVAGLDASSMARAVVESVAENTVDAVVAPAWWAAVAGAPGVLGYRAVNTMDAMVGYREDRYLRYGWASARLDDLAAFVPARLTAFLVAMVRPAAAPAIWRAVRTQAPSHPSPNAGVVEAAFAAALDLRLGGVSRYGERIEHRATLGTGRGVRPGDIARANKLSKDVSVALALLLGAVGLVISAPGPVGRTQVERARANLDKERPRQCRTPR
jgi:adenosylcobinamide-phosphate synthase